MRWECPLGRRDGRRCQMFDGPCEPRSNGCLLANAPGLDGDPSDDVETPLTTFQPIPWPQIERARRRTGYARRARKPVVRGAAGGSS